VLSSVAARLARLERELPPEDQARIAEAAGGTTLKDLTRGLVDALAPDLPPEQAAAAAQAAIKSFSDPKLRDLIVNLKRQHDQVIDNITQDQVIEVGFSEAARERARQVVGTFEKFIQEHRDEITALQILYNRPTKVPLRFEDLKALADTLQAPPHLWTESQLWQAYAALDKSKVKGASTKRILTDLVSLVRYAMHQENELVPYPERVMSNFRAWLAQQDSLPLPGDGERGVCEAVPGLHFCTVMVRSSRPARRSHQRAIPSI
jgi:type I restriction enzyme R subunit